MRKVSKMDQLRCGFRFNNALEKIIWVLENNESKEVIVMDDSDEDYFLVRDCEISEYPLLDTEVRVNAANLLAGRKEWRLGDNCNYSESQLQTAIKNNGLDQKNHTHIKQDIS
jgi:hypothetical protein